MATIYVDFTSETSLLTGTWTFTITSGTVNGVGGAALSELAINNYVRVSTGVQWYKVATVPTNDSFTITPVFQQATVTDGAGVTKKNAKGGTGIANAYCHINQATTDTVRTAGDIIKVRANQTHVYAGVNIGFDESGTVNNYITLKGCTIADDPWSDASDVKTIIDFAVTAFNCALSKAYWKVQNLEFIGCTSTSANLNLSGGHGAKISNCVFRNASLRGMTANYASFVVISDCSFHSNGSISLVIASSVCIIIKDCVFNGGSGTTYGIIFYTGTVYLSDCSFGITTSHSTSDLVFGTYGASVYGRNIILASTTEVSGLAGIAAVLGSFVKIEDDEQTKLANRAWYFMGNIERGTTDIGGVTHWLKGTPNSSCGLEQPLPLFEDLPIWLPASTKTLTVSMRASGWAASLPLASECYIELKYWDTASAKRGTAASIQAFAANDTWTNFTVTITPNSEGPAYLSAYLKKYIASAFVYVNITSLPTIT